MELIKKHICQQNRCYVYTRPGGAKAAGHQLCASLEFLPPRLVLGCCLVAWRCVFLPPCCSHRSFCGCYWPDTSSCHKNIADKEAGEKLQLFELVIETHLVTRLCSKHELSCSYPVISRQMFYSTNPIIMCTYKKKGFYNNHQTSRLVKRWVQLVVKSCRR